jgi:adenosylhomocysteine nucleosidase
VGEIVGLIAAMAMEARPLLNLIGRHERTVTGAFHSYRFTLSGRDCLLVESGMGMARASDAARAVCSSLRPGLLVSFGIAGAARGGLRIGDVVVATGTCLLDKGRTVGFTALASLPESALRAVEQALTPRRAGIFSGTAITTRGSQVVELEPGDPVNPVLEMETFGISQVALEQGIPLLSIRSISDTPDQPIPVPMEELMDEDFNLQIGKIIKTCARHPSLLPRLLRLGVNGKKAAFNAALAVMAMLEDRGGGPGGGV